MSISGPEIMLIEWVSYKLQVLVFSVPKGTEKSVCRSLDFLQTQNPFLSPGTKVQGICFDVGEMKLYDTTELQ